MQLPYWIRPERLDFPPVGLALAEPNGLLAVGGDLRPERLMMAYRSGIFPWYSRGQPILWWSPDPRTVLLPSHLKVSRSLRKVLKKGIFEVTLDTAFEAVVRACAQPRRGVSDTWITEEMKRAYTELYHLGVAHSVECWEEGRLVGGLYGVAIGRVFCGESMFSLKPDSSKVALVYLVRQLERWGYQLIDCQVYSDHLGRLGAENMPRPEFIKHLKEWRDLPGQPAPWHLGMRDAPQG